MVDMGAVSVPQGEGRYALEMSFDGSPEGGL